MAGPVCLGGTMTDSGDRLPLCEWLVLCLVREQPTYGFAITQLLSRNGAMGRIWYVPKPVIYRAMDQLERLGLIQMTGQQPSPAGPARSLCQVTPAGRKAAQAWLRRPVAHGRNVRSELLMKLALLDRAGADPRSLLNAQAAEFAPHAAALADRVHTTTGTNHTLALWRHQAMSATIQFLNDAALQAELTLPSGKATR
jgi:DNA-binding PadR family transcriptional regulator